MNQQVEERIELINNFIFETGKGESRRWVHYFNGFVTFPFIILLFLIVEVVSFSAIFNQFSNWTKADMITFFSLIIILQFPAHFINFLLYKHLDRIKEKQINCSSELNDELKYHLQSITKHFKPYWLKIPVLSLFVLDCLKECYLVLWTNQFMLLIHCGIIYHYLYLLLDFSFFGIPIAKSEGFGKI